MCNFPYIFCIMYLWSNHVYSMASASCLDVADVADQQRDHETLHDALREMGGHSEYSAASILIVATKVRKFKGNQN